MRASLNPLAAQRLLLAGLLGACALSAFLYWLVRSSSDRGRGPRAPEAAQVEARDLARQDDSPAEGTSAAAAREGRRAELTTPDSADEAAAEAFDPGVLHGRVFAGDQPVAGVELRLFPGSLERRERVAPLAQTSTDEDGRFRFRGLTPHARHTLHLQHPDYLPAEETLFPGHEERLELEPSVAVSGVVRATRDGQPLGGVEVALQRWNYAETGARERVGSSTGADGRWRLPWAEPGIERFLVLRPGFLPEEREFQVGAQGGEGFEIWLEDTLALELEVYALESGAALPGCEILSDETALHTDERGHLFVPAAKGRAPDEAIRLSLARPGGCQTQGRVAPGKVQGFLRVPVALGGTVRGRVLDASGAGVAGALVRLAGGGRVPPTYALPEGFWLNPARAPVRSGSDGSYVLGGLAPREGMVEVRAQHPDHPPGRSTPFALAILGAEHTADVSLEAGGSIAGTVRLDGEPAALRVYWNGARASGWTRADDRGGYELTGVPSGETNVKARLEDEDEDVPRAEDLVVTVADGQRATADFDLHAQRARIRGRVVDVRGAPVAKAEIVALPEEEWQGEAPRAESQSDGAFELSVPDSPGMTFELSAESGPRRAELASIPAGAENVQLVLPVLVEVTLRVRDAATREPVPAFHLYWRESESGSYERLDQGGRRLSPGADGSFLAELPGGRLDLVVTARPLGYAPAQRAGLELTGGGAVEFELERGVELELEIQVAPEAADALRQLQRGRVSVASAEQWSERERGGDLYQQEVRNAQSLRLDEAGVARLAALPGGRYRFVNVPRGFRFSPAEFDLPPVAHHRVTVTLEPTPRPRGGE